MGSHWRSMNLAIVARQGEALRTSRMEDWS